MTRAKWSSGDEDARRRGLAVQRLLERTGHSIGGRVLDVGCGEAGLIASFADPGRLAVGVERAAWLLSRARASRERLGVTFVQGEATALPFRAATFDVVVLYDVLEHVERWPVALQEAARVCRDAGSVLVTAANTRSPITIVDDPHWHKPLLALLPQRIVAWVVDRFGLAHLDMEGATPAFPAWTHLQRAFEDAGLRAHLVSNLEKLDDPEGVIDPGRRRLAAWLRRHGFAEIAARAPFRSAVTLYDLNLARSWTFIATRSVPRRADEAGEGLPHGG